MNTRAKGSRIRLKCIKELESNGWEVAIVERTGRFIKIKDMFGLFDLVAIHPNNTMKFIQVTTNKPHSHKPYREFVSKYDPHGLSFNTEQWVWIDRVGWNITYY